MGLSINNYSFLKAVNEKDEGTLKNIFHADFSLYGFIIHDPVKHDLFAPLLNSEFQQLNMMSGEKFLFTAIVDPPASWVKWARKNSRFRDMYFYDPQKLHDPELIIRSIDPSYTASYMADILGINHHYLPVIVITPNLNNDTYYFLNTSAQQIQQQLIDLNSISQELSYGNKFEELIDRLSEYKPKKIISENGSLVDKLLALSARLMETAANRGALVQERVLTMDLTVLAYTDKSGLKDDKEIEQELLAPGIVKKDPDNYINVVLHNKVFEENVIYKNDKDQIFNEIESLYYENIQHLENQTRIYFEGGLHLLEAYDKAEETSPYIIRFAKALEWEMSYSMVHWVRDRYDILLPEYFYEWQPYEEAVVQMRNLKIDFNAEKNQQWLVPMIGEQITGFQWASDIKHDSPFEQIFKHKRFLEILRTMKNIRNRACHMMPTDSTHLQKILNGWQELFEEGYLETLAELKDKYRNE
jgi:hypothetical protein